MSRRFRFGLLCAPGTYTRNIASFIRAPGWTNGACTVSGNTQCQSYLPYWNDSGAAATNIQLVFSNWWCQVNGLAGEIANGNAITITASIEASYGGTRTQVLFSGIAAGTVAGGVNLVSDPVAVSIPAGQKFGVRVLAVAVGSVVTAVTTAAGTGTTTLKVPTVGLSAGMGVTGSGIGALQWTIDHIQDAATAILSATINSTQVTNGATLTFSPVVPLCWTSSAGGTGVTSETGTALTDKTMSGTIAGTVSGYNPSAILGTVTNPSNACVACLGDSISVGAADGNYAAHNGTGIYGRSADSQVPFMSMGVTGSQVTNQQGHTSMRMDLLQKAGVTHVIVEYGCNDVAALATVANITTWLNTVHAAIKAAIPAAKVYQTTITARSTSTTNWTDTTNQAAVAGAGFSGGAGVSNRSLLNTAIRGLTGFANLTGYLEISDQLETARDSGIFVAGAGTHVTNLLLFGVFSGTPTTTVMQLQQTSMALNAYAFGKLVITSGAAASATVRSVASNTVGGLLTLSAALGVAPAAGDSYYLYAITDIATTDGIHPNVTSTAAQKGGIYYGVDYLAPVIASWR